MLFTEFRFLLFFLLVLGIYWSIPANKARKLWLLGCSYLFYAGWDWRFLSLILASTLVDYVICRAMAKRDSPRERRPYLAVSLVANLGILGFFKYYNFFIESASVFTDWIGLPLSDLTLQIILPIGISFYTFQTLSYSIDVYRGRLKVRKSLLDVSLFVAFFPQLVAGPIVRAAEFLPQLDEARRFRDVDLRAHLTLFLVGYAKKACVADRIAEVVDPIFAEPALHSVASMWLGISLYSVQLYCDFSGYSDMAIACAGLLGYRLRENFNHPYIARNIQEFWARWHISLASWFRDYVFMPLSFSGTLKRRLPVDAGIYLSLMITWTLIGLWHGASWNFVVWGMYQGILLILHRSFRRQLNKVAPTSKAGVAGWDFACWLTTYMLVVFGLVVFRTSDVSSSIAFFGGMFGVSTLPAPPELIEIASGWWILLVAFAVAHWAFARQTPMARVAKLPAGVFSAGYGLAVALILPWAASGYSPFIYFQF